MTEEQRVELRWALDLLREYMATEEGMADNDGEYEAIQVLGRRLDALETSLDLLSSR